MYLMDQRVLGVIILALWAALLVVKQRAAGPSFERPGGRLLLRFVNTFNLLFLLVVNPLIAVLLITRRVTITGQGQAGAELSWVRAVSEVTGLVLFVGGFLLLMWAFRALGRNFQLGGSAPRSQDEMVTGGPFRFVRHPMYAAAMSISLGLFCLVGSWLLLAVFVVYLVGVVLTIPIEEDGLRKAYGERYVAYARSVKKVVPGVF